MIPSRVGSNWSDAFRRTERALSLPLKLRSKYKSDIFKLNMEVRMATTSMTLGPHWEGFIRSEVESGRYASASEVVRAALRQLEDRSKSLEALRTHLAEGADQAAKGVHAEGWSVEDILNRAGARLG